MVSNSPVLPESQGLMVSNGSLPTLRQHTQRHGSWDSKPSLHRCRRPWWEQGISAPVTPTSRLKRVSSKATPPKSKASKGLKALSFLSPGTTTKVEPATGVTHPTYSTEVPTEATLVVPTTALMAASDRPLVEPVAKTATRYWSHYPKTTGEGTSTQMGPKVGVPPCTLRGQDTQHGLDHEPTPREGMVGPSGRHEVQDITDPLPGTGKPSNNGLHTDPLDRIRCAGAPQQDEGWGSLPTQDPTSLGDCVGSPNGLAFSGSMPVNGSGRRRRPSRNKEWTR